MPACIARRAATGTFENDDPQQPAWRARFGDPRFGRTARLRLLPACPLGFPVRGEILSGRTIVQPYHPRPAFVAKSETGAIVS